MTDNIVLRHRKVWENKKILRVIYTEWFEKIKKDLSSTKGITLELGSGSGNFKEFMPDSVSSDVESYEWLDYTFDAHKMPFGDNSISNIVMIDVLHHLNNPVIFLDEAFRVLNKNGRIIMIEPFPTPFSLIIYRLFHPEPFQFNINYFTKKELDEKLPWDSNQAIPYLIFFKNINLFETGFKNKFNILKKDKFSFILYPLSGGFENRQLIPDLFIPLFQKAEKFLSPLKSLLAFRCYIVIEKK